MWSNLVPAVGWMFAWLLLVTSIHFWIDVRQSRFQSWAILSPHALTIVLLVALFVRLVPMGLLPVGAGYDIESYRLVANARLAGQEVYNSAAIYRHPYLPFQMYIIEASLRLAQWVRLPFVVVVKSTAVLADIGICWAIYRITMRNGRSRPVAIGNSFRYALNPVPILVTAYHGQFDTIPLLFILLGWIVWQTYANKTISATFLGLAILNKTWPIIIFPIYILRLWKTNKKQLLTFSLITFAIPLFITWLYIAIENPVKLNPMLQRALTHSGPTGYWGVLNFVGFLPESSAIRQAIFSFIEANNRLFMALGLGLAYMLTYKQRISSIILTVLAVALAISAGMGIQWLVWIVPFAVLEEEQKWLNAYTIAASFMILGHLYGLHFHPWAYKFFGEQRGFALVQMTSIPAWFVVISWAISRLYTAYRQFSLTDFFNFVISPTVPSETV